MFYHKFFLSDHSVSSKGGGRIPPPSDVSPTEKHADVTRVKKKIFYGVLFFIEKCFITNFFVRPFSVLKRRGGPRRCFAYQKHADVTRVKKRLVNWTLYTTILKFNQQLCLNFAWFNSGNSDFSLMAIISFYYLILSHLTLIYGYDPALHFNFEVTNLKYFYCASLQLPPVRF